MGQLHLGLDARRSIDLEVLRAGGKMLEQRCLADPRIAAENERPTLTGSHSREQTVKDLKLSSPSAQSGLNLISQRERLMLFAIDSGVNRDRFVVNEVRSRASQEAQ